MKVVLENLKNVQAVLKQLNHSTEALHTSLESLNEVCSPNASKFLNGEGEEMTTGVLCLKYLFLRSIQSVIVT